MKLVQIKNPKTKEWVLIDKEAGFIIGKRKCQWSNVTIINTSKNNKRMLDENNENKRTY